MASADTPVSTEAQVDTTPAEIETSETDKPELNSSDQPQELEAGKSEEGQTKEEETFFDPNQVPEELKPAYKQMQAAFTKKTQEIAEARKSSEGLKTKAEAYDKYQHLIPIVEEMMASKGAESIENPSLVALEEELKKEGYSDDAIKMMKLGANVILKQVNSSQTQEKEQARLESSIAQAEKLDPRLNDESLTYTVKDGKVLTYGQLVSKMVFSDPEWTKDPVGATKDAIETLDALIGKAKTEGKTELSNSAKSRSAKFPSVTSSPQSAASDSQPKTVQEAAAEAKKELGL